MKADFLAAFFEYTIDSLPPMSESTAPNGIGFFQYETIVVNNILLGAWDGERWVDAEKLCPMLPDKNLYTLYMENDSVQIETGSKGTIWPVVDVSITMGNSDRILSLPRYIALSSEESLDFWPLNLPRLKPEDSCFTAHR